MTDQESLALVEMVLCGTANKRLVRYLVAGGVDAQGMERCGSRADPREKMHHEY